MAIAICDNQHITHWRARRGCKLANVRCSSSGCSAKLHAAAWTPGGWQRRATKTNGQRGRKKAICAICGRSSFCETRPKAILTHLLSGAGYTHRMPVIIEADDAICWRHSIFPFKSWFTHDAQVFNWLRA